MRSALVMDIAEVLIGDRRIETVVTGIRPGEKLHEILVSDEEGYRAVSRAGYYVIMPILPELRSAAEEGTNLLGQEYSSADTTMTQAELIGLLSKHHLMVEDRIVYEEDMLA